MKTNNLAKTSIYSAALLYPGTILLAKIFEYVIKSINPDSIERVNQTLSYLSQILTFGMVVFIVIFVISFVTGMLAYKQDRSQLALLALKLLGAQAALTAVIFVLIMLIKYLDM